MANMIIKKGKFETENKGTVIGYTTWINVDDESTEVVLVGKSKSDKNIIEFRDAIAKVIAKYRRRGKVVEF